MKNTTQYYIQHCLCSAILSILVLGYVTVSAFAADEHRVYKFSVPPWQKEQTDDDYLADFRPVFEWLEQKTGLQFVLVAAKDYQQTSTFLSDGAVDLAYLGPAGFVAAQRKNPGVKMLVTEWRWNEDRTEHVDSYTSRIITLQQRGDIVSLADLQGKTFGFVNPESTSGFVLPNFLLRQRGIDYTTFFKQYFFVGSHTRVIEALVAGSIDAGAVWSGEMQDAIATHGEVFKILLESPPVPNSGIAVHPSIPVAVQQQIRSALLLLPPELFSGITADGFVVKPEGFYDIIRDLEEEHSTQKIAQ